MKTIFSLFVALGFGLCLMSCGNIMSYPDEPEIHFKELEFRNIKDTLDDEYRKMAVLTFSFFDGNGDIGSSPQDVLTISSVYFEWYKKITAQPANEDPYEIFQFLTGETTLKSAIPYSKVMDKTEANNKVLKGTIEITLHSTPWLFTIPAEVDTMHIKFWIKDRAGNESNYEFTPDFNIREAIAE